MRVIWKDGHGRITTAIAINPSYEIADQIGQMKDYGKTLLIEDYVRLSFLERLKDAWWNFFAGLYERYPICCVANYAIDELLDRQHCVYRWRDNTDVVPCVFHWLLSGRQRAPDDQW